MLKIEELAKICAQLDYSLMPVFSGNNVETLINKLDTKKIDLAVEKKKYDGFNRKIHSIFDTQAVLASQSKNTKGESFYSEYSTASRGIK